MPLDPSIPLQGQMPQNNFLQPLQQASTIMQLRGQQMQIGANQALANAYQQSVNPDGSVDFGKLQTIAAQNGAGAFLPEFMGKIAAQRNQQQQYDTSVLDMNIKKLQQIRGALGSLMNDPDMGKNDMSSQIISNMSELVRNGVLPMDRALQEIQNVPSDPKQQAMYIKQHFLNSLSGEAKMQALLPKVQTVDTGGQVNVLNTNPMSGETNVTGVIGKTLTPGEASSNVTYTDPTTGRQYTITKKQQLEGVGQGGVNGYTGRPGSAGQPSGLLTGLGPSEQSALTGMGSTSNAAAQTLHNAASDAPMRINLLNQARDVLQGIAATGPSTDQWNHIKSWLNNFGPSFLGSDPRQIANYDEFKKILTNYASSVSGSLGTGTDARLNAAVTGNANPNISKLANEDILAKTIAAEKMRAAQDYAFQQSGLTTDKFNKWQSQWNKAVDPNLFVFNSMSPAQRQVFVKRMNPTQLNTFRGQYNNAVAQGLIQE
jgi:hypothetical protein